MSDQSKIITRIKALIAKAESTEHEAEAMAFMSKAQQLLEEHQIQLGDLDGSGDEVLVKPSSFAQTGKDPTWLKKIYTCLASYYGCRVVYSPEWMRGQWGFRIELTGRESAIVTTELMYPFIKKQCLAAGRRLHKDYPCMTSSQHARRVGNALAVRLAALAMEEKRRNQTAPRTEAAAKNALVTTNRVDQLFDEHYGDIKDARSSRITTTEAAREEAGKVSLSRQVGESSALQLAYAK